MRYIAPLLLSLNAFSEAVEPLEKIIAQKQDYYDFNGTSPITVAQKNIDTITQSGVILNYAMQKKLKGKKTPSELQQSLAVGTDKKTGDVAETGDIEALKEEMMDKPKYSHTFVLERKPPKKENLPPKTAKDGTIEHQLYYGEK